MYRIRILQPDGEPPVELLNEASGQTLLELCLAHNIHLRHQCGGVCVCTTCCVRVEEGGEFLHEMERRERDFLRSKKKGTAGARLACQALLKAGRGTVVFRIPASE